MEVITSAGDYIQLETVNVDKNPIESVYRKLKVFEYDENPEEALKQWMK